MSDKELHSNIKETEDKNEMLVVDIRDKAEEAFDNYAKELLLDRVFPDYRDGLTPVQRRVLYGMYDMGLGYKSSGKPARQVKSARIVGDVMGKYHPHGDSGIYGAMTKMGKEWVYAHPLVELIGNNGSSDGDNPASMRYTLARLSKMSSYLTDGLNKKGLVDWQLTYEDTDYEPRFLPAQFPNLIVNGSVGGIAIGYVVDILPHNLAEVLNLSIQDARGEELDDIAPDFPTGGQIVNGDELADMYDTGIGRAVVRGKYKVETAGRKRSNKRKIVFYEFPYGVQKTKVVEKIQTLISNNGTSSKQQLSGAVKVQDESGSDGERVAITVADDADITVLTEIIYKYTLLEKSQRYEFLTILNGQPTRMSLKRYINEFNKFRRETIIREKVSDNKVIETKVMRLDAMIKLDGIRDEVIQTIRDSNNRTHALENLVTLYSYTEEQADYLLSLQLSRLTKDNYDKYRSDRKELLEILDANNNLINDPELINEYMIAGYLKLIEELGEDRKTEVLSEVREVDLSIENVIPLEETMVGITPEGNIKRSTIRSHNATQSIDFEVLGIEATTHEELLVFTDLGQVAVIPVKDIPEMRWGDIGDTLVTTTKNFHIDEKVIGIGIKDKVKDIMLITNDNRVKTLLPSEFDFKTTSTFYTIMPIDKDNRVQVDSSTEDYERVIGITEVSEDTSVVLMTTNKKKTIDYGLAFKTTEVTPTGRTAKGRKMASISRSKRFDKLYLSGNLEKSDYREVGKAPVKGVYPVDVKEVKHAHFVSNSMAVTNQPVIEEVDKDTEEVIETEE